MKLKHISLFLLSGLATLTMTSCEDFADGFLTQTNPNELSSDIFWSTLEECDEGIVAVYKTFSNDNLMLTPAESNRSDITLAGVWPAWTPTNVFYNHTFNDATSEVGNRWAQLYEGIFRANQVIEGLKSIEANMVDEDDINDWEHIMGQALFFRGLFHHYASLTYNYGNVPIMDFVPINEDDFLQPCYSADIVREFCIEDLLAAEALLPANGDSDAWNLADGTMGRVTSGAASAVLGTIYLYNEQYEEAKFYFEKILDNSNYSLADHVYHNFNGDNEFNSESILEINYTTDFNTEYGLWDAMNLTTSVNYSVANTSSGGWGSVLPSYWLYRDFVFEPVDRRNADNIVYLEHDIHGDIYYLNNKNEVVTTVDGKTYHTYIVLRKDKIETGGNDAMSYYDKTVEVDSSGNPVITDITKLSDDEKNEIYDLSYGSYSAYPMRAYKTVPKATTESFDVEGTTITQQVGDCWKVFYDASGEPYRYKVHSDRASYSVMMPIEYDVTFYQKAQGLEVWPCSNAYGCYRKFTNWELSKETDASSQGRSALNVRVIRLADIYLMYAEALIEGGTNDAGVAEAIYYINEVRERAGTVLIGSEVGAPYQGIRTYQDSTDPEESDGETYYNLYNRDGEDDIIDTAEEVMDHLMYKERPLELCLEGFSIRYVDIRRWGIAKERFQQLNREPFSTQAMTYYKTDAQEYGTMWTWSHDYEEGCEPKYQYADASINYGDSKSYFPIPSDEAIANPNIGTVLTERGTSNEIDE